MSTLILLLSLFAFAQERAVEKFCFNSTASAQQALHSFEVIKVPADNAAVDKECLVIEMPPHRRELIQKSILSLPGASLSFSSASLRKEPCKLKVTKQKKLKKVAASAGVNGDLQLQGTKAEELATETMQIETLKDFSLSVDQDEITGTCRYITPVRYEIALEVRTNPGPQQSPLLPAPDQKTSQLKTELQLSKGQKIELGSIIKNLRRTSADISTTPSVEKADGEEREIVYLSLDEAH